MRVLVTVQALQLILEGHISTHMGRQAQALLVRPGGENVYCLVHCLSWLV